MRVSVCECVFGCVRALWAKRPCFCTPVCDLGPVWEKKKVEVGKTDREEQRCLKDYCGRRLGLGAPVPDLRETCGTSTALPYCPFIQAVPNP